MKILILGASGMIGSTVFRILAARNGWEVFGTLRDRNVKRFFLTEVADHLISGVDVENEDILVKVFERVRPEIVINCAGLTKHKPESDHPLVSLPINSLLPHRLAALCQLVKARFVHISTDCVFSGQNGNYSENDFTDARDTYGKSKVLGEVVGPRIVTLRTSTIGHELQTAYGLLDWFLSQRTACKGFTRAVFSGLPTVVLAQVIRDAVIPHENLSGLYHVAARPISKFDLLHIIAKRYEKNIEIVADPSLVIDRSLKADRFYSATGYVPPNWHDLIDTMYLDRMSATHAPAATD